MGYQIFEMADGERVAVYAQGNSIFSCLLSFSRGNNPRGNNPLGSNPLEVKRDYLAYLDAAVFRDTVCYVYENLEHQVILDTLGAAPARILLTDGALYGGFFGLRLYVRQGELYLFYQAGGRKGEPYSLYVCMPCQENRWTVVCRAESRLGLAKMETNLGTVLVCTEETSGQIHIFDWRGELEFVQRRVVEEKEHGRRVEQLQAAWEEEREGLEAQREQLQAETMAKLGEFQQEKEERLIQCRKEYEGKVERLRQEYEEKLARCRESHENQLLQAKRQYDELAETAVKLQQIGKRWRDKYFGRMEERR